MIQLGYAAKKYVFDILQERYGPHEDIVNRLSHYLATEKDVHSFCQLIAESYSKGYGKAVADYREKLRDLGYDVQVIAE